jgi:hypothetical protein
VRQLPLPGTSPGHGRVLRTCVLDGALEHSPAEHVRHPSVPDGSPTLGFTHPQFEALLTAARQSANPALTCMSGQVKHPGEGNRIHTARRLRALAEVVVIHEVDDKAGPLHGFAGSQILKVPIQR